MYPLPHLHLNEVTLEQTYPESIYGSRLYFDSILNILPGLGSPHGELSQLNGKESGEYQVSVAANETVGAEGQTIMIIQSDEQLDASQVTNALSGGGTTLQLANIEVCDNSRV